MAMRRILILGGTAEARCLAARLGPRAELAVTLSLAGRTASPAAQPVPVRIGGFGGTDGLADYLTVERIDALVDATHPYAATISANAARAAQRANVPLLTLRRPPWIAVAGDRWIEVADVTGAVHALAGAPRRVFVALGRKELQPFVHAPQHYYLVRSIDPVDPPLAVPQAAYITGRGPFEETAERGLLARHRIDIIIAKNSGGSASYGKIAAARALGLPVIVLRRPAQTQTPAVDKVEAVLAWLDHVLTASIARGV
jgi:precorrin-6A/cobalt-precorrin-6A reductase